MKLHPDVKRNFDQKGGALQNALREVVHHSTEEDRNFPIDPHIAARIAGEDIQSFGYWSKTDYVGDEIARFFEVDGKVVGLDGDDFIRARQLAEQIQRTKQFREKIAPETVLDAIFSWLRNSAAGTTSQQLSDYVLSECISAVGDQTVIIPIHELFIQRAFELGHVRIRSVSRDEIDGWLAAQHNADSDDASSFEKAAERWRKIFQGKAVAEMSTEADPIQAYNMARAAAEDALAVLRLFSPAMFDARLVSYCTLLGNERLRRSTYVLYTDGELATISESIDAPRGTFWKISANDLDFMYQHGLADFHELLLDPDSTRFRASIMESLLIYSRAATEPRLAEKLIYIVVGLESMLLRNDTEPVQANVSERLAFTIGTTKQRRKEIIRDVKDAYGLRSRFLHHGRRVGDIELMNRFMHYAWNFFAVLARNRDRFASKEEFIDALDDRKLA